MSFFDPLMTIRTVDGTAVLVPNEGHDNRLGVKKSPRRMTNRRSARDRLATGGATALRQPD